MIEIRPIGEANKQDINLPNEPFSLFGRMIPSYTHRHWDYTVERFETVSEMCFPDENYNYAEMVKDCSFLGACLFYLKNGFRIGGFDTEVYQGTRQEGKADIYFYLDC